MTPTNDTALVIIKSLTIGRGDGPSILSDILAHDDIKLHNFRAWNWCVNTLTAMARVEGWDDQRLGEELLLLTRERKVWVCEFISTDSERPVHSVLNSYFGPEERERWLPAHMRHRYSAYRTLGNATHPTDTVVYLASQEKTDLIRDLLF